MLNYRTVEILSYLLDCESEVQLQNLLDTFGITRRNLYYDFEKINDWLNLNGFAAITIKLNNIYLEEKNRSMIRQCLNKLTAADYVFSSYERETYAAFILVTSSEKVTLDCICEYLYISRSTGKTMMSNLRDSLKEAGIDLGSDKNGYYIKSDDNEVIIRQELYNRLKKGCGTIAQHIIAKFVESKLIESYPHFSQTPVYEWIVSLLYQCESILKKTFVDTTIDNLSLLILFTIVRSIVGIDIIFSFNEKKTIESTREYSASVYFTSALKEKGIEVTDNVTVYIAVLLLGAQSFDIQLSPRIEKEITSLTEKIILSVENKMNIVIPEKEAFKKTLLVHMQPMYYRIKYGITTDNPLEDEIVNLYPQLFKYVKESMQNLMKDKSVNISVSELSYICVYFASWFKRHGVEFRSSHQNRILLICHSGMGTSLFLQEQLVAILGQEYSYQITSARNAHKYCFDDYLLVLSTIGIETDNDNFMIVSPLLTVDQRKLIINKTGVTSNIYAGDVKINEILDIFKENGTVYNEDKVIHQLTQYFRRNKKCLNEQIPVKSKFSVFSHITSSLCDEHAALRLVCKPFIENNITSFEYIESVEKIVDSFGLYFEVSDGILLIHSSADVHMSQVALSICLFKTPVLFEKYGKSIQAMIAFTSPSNTEHSTMMKLLLEYITLGNNRSRLKDCGFSSAEQLNKELKYFFKGAE